jgi:hypothetical protein
MAGQGYGGPDRRPLRDGQFAVFGPGGANLVGPPLALEGSSAGDGGTARPNYGRPGDSVTVTPSLVKNPR